MVILAVTRVGRYYRTTVPREVRRILGVDSGDPIEKVFEDGRIIVRRSERSG